MTSLTDLKVVCEHVSGPLDLVQMCRVPGPDERLVACSCCGLHGIVSKDDDLAEPMMCPYCDREAVLVEPRSNDQPQHQPTRSNVMTWSLNANGHTNTEDAEKNIALVLGTALKSLPAEDVSSVTFAGNYVNGDLRELVGDPVDTSG